MNQNRLHRTRNGSMLRQVILFTLLLVVVSAGAYEFLVARPAFDAAWQEILELESSTKINHITPEIVEDRIGREAVATIDTDRNAEVRVYSWPSGLLVRNHVIRVVYSKALPSLIAADPSHADYRSYYSAAANSWPELPPERPTLVRNLNKPTASGGGAPSGGGGGTPEPVISSGDSSDKQGDEKQGDDKDGDDKDGDDKDGDDKDGDNKDGDNSEDQPDSTPSDKADDKESGDEDQSASDDAEGEEKGEDPPADDDDSGDGNR